VSTYAVSFSLSQPEKKYKGFFSALEKLGAIKVLQNTFFIRTDNDIEEMRIALLPYLDKRDGLVIVSVKGETAVRNAKCSPLELKELLTGEN